MLQGKIKTHPYVIRIFTDKNQRKVRCKRVRVRSPVSEGSRVDFDKPSAVDKHFRSHMAHGHQLCPVFQSSVVLFKDLLGRK